jgi:asparagine synthase (glutamine-hydrolysing)
MAARLMPPKGGEMHLLVSKTNALATVSIGNRADTCQDGEKLAAVIGQPRWSDPHLIDSAGRHGAARALLIGYTQKGPDVLKSMGGHFAVAVLDGHKNAALLAVDRMGICPLVYTFVKDCLVFSSTTDGISVHPSVDSTVDPQAIFEYFYFSVVPSPRTIYAEQRKLEPAQYLHYRCGHKDTAYYWQPNFCDSSNSTFEELRDELHAILRRAVKRSDPVCEAGAFLSGGIDSSSLCGIVSEVCKRPPKTYSIGFNAEGFDEIEYARITSRHFSTESHEYYLTPQDVVDALPYVARAYDEPFGNSSAVPVYYCARLARYDGTKVMLAGDGGDELFAGNVRYVKQKVFELYSKIPRSLRSAIIEPVIFAFPGLNASKLLRKTRSYIHQAKIPLPERLETYNLLHMFPLSEIFNSDFLDLVSHRSPAKILQHTYARAGSKSPLNKMLFLDWKVTLADNDLRKVNRMCELWGIQVRYPMLDDDLVEFSTQVPPALKLKGFKTRHFFKHALKEFLPQEVLRKQKHGFGLPFGIWLNANSQLQQLVYDTLHDIKSRNYIRPRFVDFLMEKHRKEHPGFYGNALWPLVMLELWLNARAGQ